MSFPTDIYGAEGEQWETYSDQRHVLGTRLVLQDGRTFRFVENGGTLLVTGNVIQAEAPGANFDELVVPSAAAIGAETVTVTLGSTAAAVDLFAEGYLFVEDDAGESFLYPVRSHPAAAVDLFAEGYLFVEDDAGESFLYPVRSHPAAATSATMVVTIWNSIQVALTASSTVLLLKSLYKDVIQLPTTGTGDIVGVAVKAIAADEYGWIQTHGPCGVLTDGTLVIGQHIRASDGTAGAVEPLNRDGTGEDEAELGRVISVSATTEQSLCYLTIE